VAGEECGNVEKKGMTKLGELVKENRWNAGDAFDQKEVALTDRG